MDASLAPQYLELTRHPLLQPLLQATREGVCLLDQQGQVLFCNARLREWLAYEHDEDYRLEKMLAPSGDARRLRQCLRHGKTRHGNFNLELQALKEPIPVQLRLSMVEWEGRVWLLQLTDLRRERQLESSLAGSLDHQESLLRILPVPVVIVRSHDGRILQGNEEFVSWYGIPGQGQSAVSIADFFFHRSDWLFVMEEARRRNGQCMRDVQVRNSDGSTAWAQTWAQQTNFEGHAALLLVFQDITQSKQIEKSLEWRNRLVMAMMTAQSQFVANIDPDTLFLHILNNLLAMTYSEFGFLAALDPEFPETIQVLAVEHTRWDIETVEQYVRTAQQEFEQLHSQDHLLLQPLSSQQMVVYGREEHEESLPSYPWMHNFIGVPLFSSGKLVGMLGMANSPYPYGETLRMELNPLLVTAGHIMAAWRNDWLRRRAERELQLSHQHLNQLHLDLRQLVDTACTPIFGLDLQGVINEWNPAAAQLTGIETEEVLTGMLVYQVVAPEFHAEVESTLARVCAGEAIAGLELVLRTRHADPVRILCSLTPRRNEAGQLMGVWGVGQDITYLADYQQRLQQEVQSKTRALQNTLFEQRQLTEQLKDTLQKEQDLFAFKERFVTIASHEFRGPLAAILMAAENLCNLADVLTPDQVQRKIQRIRERAGQLHYIVNDILVLTQIDAGHIRFHPEACRVAELCDDIIEEVLLATQHTHKVHVAHAEPGLQARLDKNLMRIMLSNLLHNAIKFSFDSAEVWLRVLPQAEALRFEVEDRGIGITSEELPHLFEPFYRSERVIFSTSGSGLGLELVQRALQIHQGQIEITRLDQGSLFRLGIPLRT